MAIFKCKMCGGDLELSEGMSVAECEYCGSLQTVPSADNEKKMTLFSRANRLRAGCEFDKAAGVYETIVADFPEEAEAYWGLLLCRYGIEYVDDPATGKKVPTCHRSSFDSVMEDSDFEQACENADAYARRVYRDEAKTIEELRRGIIAVSANEQPYDIFICYKETTDDGERTLDSVLAQDIYDALTGKGYRVFFSRVTLEDKLGVEYEPYIFAALNSAKLMLAVGTDYEHYNAVWVKNEWSRFLKLMAADKGKYLIPCFKGLDAYDMPKEFARLQAQDMGKVGAMQDLMRGIEKILPKNQPAIVMQEKVILNESGNAKIASLLDRGNMALEDGDWEKADNFFEDVLNNDSKNAQAYLGKTLAQEKCRTLDAFIRKRQEASQGVRGETLHFEPDTVHIDEAVNQFSLPGYVSESRIRELYEFDLSYHSDVAERQQQYKDEQSYWDKHKWLSKAEKFATGETAETLAQEKKALFTALDERVTEAKANEAAKSGETKARYTQHLQEADAQAEALYQGGSKRKEEYYQQLLHLAKTSRDITELTLTAERLEALGDYQDSKALAQHCHKRIAEEKAEAERLAAEAHLAAEKAAKERAAKKKKIGIISGIAAVVITAAVLLVTQVIIPNGEYNKAAALAEAGNTAQAAIAFGGLDYKDSTERSMALWDEIAVNTISTGRCFTVGLEADGRVITTGSNKWGQGECSDWTSIVSVSAGDHHTVGLKANGTVVAVGYNENKQCEVSDWTNIVAVSGGGLHTVGLKTDGTVVAVGENGYGQCDVSKWTDIVAIATGDAHTIGLKADGTVVAVGYNADGECDVASWTDIVAISAGYEHTVGLKVDGTVVAVGTTGEGRCEVADWTDIMAISAGDYHTVGLKADGTLVAVGNNKYSQCDVHDLSDIVAVSAGNVQTVCLKADGTAVAVGFSDDGRIDVSDWTNIRLPE